MYLSFVGGPENGLERLGWPKHERGRVGVFGEDRHGSCETHDNVPGDEVEAVCNDYNS